jgi:ribose transport system substrate-binding protein
MGVNSGVDGIALQAADSEQTSLMLEDAKDHGIAVLTYENDNYQVQNTPMVGTNSYSLGSLAGDMAVKATNGHANVAVIINNEGDQGDLQYKNMLIQGLLDATSIYSIKIDAKESIYTINANMFEAEKITSSIIRNLDKFDVIICFDESSTPGIAQTLVDNNLVGDIQIIGYGITPQTLDYIERGVIYGTVCPNAREIGYNAVKQLVESLNGEQISDSVSTELYTIDKSNAEQFSKEFEQNQEGVVK